jgi:hypothetical protein
VQLFQDFPDPEDRVIDETDRLAKKDKMLDKTNADTFPASDPPSPLPDPDEDSLLPDSGEPEGLTEYGGQGRHAFVVQRLNSATSSFGQGSSQHVPIFQSGVNL